MTMLVRLIKELQHFNVLHLGSRFNDGNKQNICPKYIPFRCVIAFTEHVLRILNLNICVI